MIIVLNLIANVKNKQPVLHPKQLQLKGAGFKNAMKRIFKGIPFLNPQ